MVLLFQKHDNPRCFLCGEKGILTGEHKIKAAMLKQEFGNSQLYVCKTGETEDKPRLAQSIKSKHLKFNSKICQSCNTDRTQLPDYEFDNFSKLARQKFTLGKDPKTLFDEKPYLKGSDSYLNLFRYFSKILCCQLAECGAPIPRRLALFTIGKLQNNYVWLDIQKDWTYTQAEIHMGDFQYAAHGGLLIYGDENSGVPTAFHSTLTLGPLQYIFFMHLAPIEIFELKYFYREFYNWCRICVDRAKLEPLSDNQKLRLGFFR
ncbi:MAG: hypothetical protein HEP80_13055 [Dolichospermum sp. UKL201]|jgi:hypothetical protein|nr:MAG: hypothetical protein HEP80_13055 [Dolichospermum sp. UKL201]